MNRLTTFPTLLQIEVTGKVLMGVTRQGPVPLYRYAPLQAAILSGQQVPLAAHWPEHLKLFIYRYNPVPMLGAERLPPGLEDRFGSCKREADTLRCQIQLSYLGWPLYMYMLDHITSSHTGIIPMLFEHINTDVLPLPPPGNCPQGP